MVNNNKSRKFNILLFYDSRFDSCLSKITKGEHNFDILTLEENNATIFNKLTNNRYEIVICNSQEELISVKNYDVTKICILHNNLEPGFPFEDFNKKSYLLFFSENVKEKSNLQGDFIDPSADDFSEQWNRYLGKCTSLNRELDKNILSKISSFGDEKDSIPIDSKNKTAIRACVFLYPIFAVDCFYTLRNMGYDVISLPMGIHTSDSLDSKDFTSLMNFQPHFCLSINFYPDLAKKLKAVNIPYLSWLADPVIEDSFFQQDIADNNNFVFTFSRSDKELFKQHGFTNAFYLPLAANIKRNRPRDLSADKKTKYECNISFVGSSITDNDYAANMVQGLEKIKSCSDPSEKERLVRMLTLYEEAINTQLLSNEYILPELTQSMENEKNTGFYYEINPGCKKERFLLDISLEASSRRRKRIIQKISGLGIHLYGDAYWKFLENDDIKYRGSAEHYYELSLIYNASKININISRVFHKDAVIMRIFDILACKGFLLTEYKKELEEFFTIGEDLVCYRSADEAYELAQYYLEHPQERQKIAHNGCKKVIEKHSMQNRLEYLLKTVSQQIHRINIYQ